MTLPDDISTESPAWSGEDLETNPHLAVDKAKRVEAMFTSIAHKYDLNNRIHSMWQDQVWRQRAVALSNVTEKDDVVDVFRAKERRQEPARRYTSALTPLSDAPSAETPRQAVPGTVCQVAWAKPAAEYVSLEAPRPPRASQPHPGPPVNM